MIRMLTAFAAVTLVAEACRSQSGNASPEECAPVTAALAATASAEGLEGKYRLKLVAESGARKGAVADGMLWLEPQQGALRYRTRLSGGRDSSVVFPLFGRTDVDLGSVDAVLVGRLDSQDPEQPGILVIERRSRTDSARVTEITVRFGSEANRRDRTRFDGGYTVLRVRRVSPRGFAGLWASGVVGDRSAGYFCAMRVDGR